MHGFAGVTKVVTASVAGTTTTLTGQQQFIVQPGTSPGGKVLAPHTIQLAAGRPLIAKGASLINYDQYYHIQG
jgi:hypothetical protein